MGLPVQCSPPLPHPRVERLGQEGELACPVSREPLVLSTSFLLWRVTSASLGHSSQKSFCRNCVLLGQLSVSRLLESCGGSLADQPAGAALRGKAGGERGAEGLERGPGIFGCAPLLPRLPTRPSTRSTVFLWHHAQCLCECPGLGIRDSFLRAA